MPDTDLRPDCARCAALCCVAFHFDRSDQFGFDKAAGEPCAHLAEGGGCAIHERRLEQGFAGCIAYDCHGAGQAVTQGLFGGEDWRRDGTLLGPMMEAFLKVERAHHLLVVLRQADRLPLSPAHRRGLDQLTAAVRQAAASATAITALEAQAHSFLRGLRGYVTPA